MLRLSALLFIYFLTCPITAYTLGFGNLTVYSKLNEPLKVSIKLVDSQKVDINDIKVRNAGRTTYKRARLPNPEILKKVHFTTRKVSDGSILIELTSKKPVKEPFISFIIDMKWRTGHLNREYTFLLDPPEFIHNKSIKTTAKKQKYKTTRQIKTARQKKPKRLKKTHIIPRPAILTNASDDIYGPTKRADTLWGIAKRVKPDQQVSTYQTMQALFALNPDAFINGNINLLKQGVSLQLPSSNEVREINGKPLLAKAKKTLRQNSITATTKPQNSAKQVVNNNRDELTKNQQTASATQSEQPEQQAQLKIIPPTEKIIDSPITTPEDLLLINKALQTSITTIKSLQGENKSLSNKITQLTDKLNKLDTYNNKLNNKLSKISQQLSNRRNKVIDNMTQSKNEEQSLASSKTTPQKANSPATLQVEVEVENKISSNKNLFIRELFTNPMVTFALAIFTLIVLITTLISIRYHSNKRQDKKQKNTTEIQSTSVPSANNNAKTVQTADSNTDSYLSSFKKNELTEEKDEEDMDFFEYFEKKINAPDEQSTNEINFEDTADISFDLDINPEELAKLKQEDSISKDISLDVMLSEIDTYLAYGNYNKAEELLNNALKKNSSNNNLHLKLFECYTFSNKRYEFIKHAENILDLLNIDMVLRHRIENIFQQTWNETLDINEFK